MSDYKMKTGKIGEAVVDAYKKIEDTVVGAIRRSRMPSPTPS